MNTDQNATSYRYGHVNPAGWNEDSTSIVYLDEQALLVIYVVRRTSDVACTQRLTRECCLLPALPTNES